MIECASLEEAIEAAAKHPMARFGVGIGNATSLPPMIAQSKFARGLRRGPSAAAARSIRR